MSPPGKRRHNEFNAAPPPENPRGTGKLGEANNRDIVQSGESFRVRGKTCLFGEPRGTKELIFLQKFLKFQETSFKKFLGRSGQRPASSPPRQLTVFFTLSRAIARLSAIWVW